MIVANLNWKSLPKLDNLKVIVNNIYSVLVTFKLNLFARSQSPTRVRSSWYHRHTCVLWYGEDIQGDH